jgi:GH43 family beta-xylosidase
MFVLQITNPDPFNRPFTFKGELLDVTNKRTIDGTVFEDLSGQLYSIWSGLEEDVPPPQLLYIAEISDPWTNSSERVLI